MELPEAKSVKSDALANSVGAGDRVLEDCKLSDAVDKVKMSGVICTDVDRDDDNGDDTSSDCANEDVDAVTGSEPVTTGAYRVFELSETVALESVGELDDVESEAIDS